MSDMLRAARAMRSAFGDIARVTGGEDDGYSATVPTRGVADERLRSLMEHEAGEEVLVVQVGDTRHILGPSPWRCNSAAPATYTT